MITENIDGQNGALSKHQSHTDGGSSQKIDRIISAHTMKAFTRDFSQEHVIPQAWFIEWHIVTTAQHSVVLVSIVLWLSKASGHNGTT